MAKQQPKIGPVPVPAVASATAWERLPDSKKRVAFERLQLIRPVLDAITAGATRRTAIDNFILRITAGHASAPIRDLAMHLGRNNKPPARATLYRWVNDYLNSDNNIASLAPSHRGSTRTLYGWEARAQHLYAQPQQPDAAAVALWLRQEGHDTATASRVRSYLKSLPTDKTIFSNGRIGAKFARDTQRLHVTRNTDVLPVGFIYQGDGHTCDTYVAHPATGKIWRPELTTWIDVRTRYIVGWYLSESESALSTLFALSHALLLHDHVPAMLHIDNGSGFRAKMVNQKSLGFYAQLSMEPIFALPGNSKGKGQKERWFGTFEGQFGKRWPTYCGEDMAPEVLRKIVQRVNSGKLELPTLYEYAAGIADYVKLYNNNPHSSLDGKTPAELWATLQRTPVHIPASALIRPQQQVTVIRMTIRLHNRKYSAPELVQYGNQKMIAEYDIHCDKSIRVLDNDGRWICDAKLIEKRDYLPASRIDEAQQKRLAGQEKRLQNKLNETRKRGQRAITHDQHLELIEDMTSDVLDDSRDDDTELNFDIPGEIVESRADDDDDFEIDLTNLDF